MQYLHIQGCMGGGDHYAAATECSQPSSSLRVWTLCLDRNGKEKIWVWEKKRFPGVGATGDSISTVSLCPLNGQSFKEILHWTPAKFH